ncbi:MAG: TRCF domain-containing protein, partial [Oscillospiraceae bacterium]
AVAGRLRELLPDARVAVGHGKMGEDRLAVLWQQLVEHEIDILVCTTIIETGVDVSNCNTLIIEDADRMGLSQLYQLRGRVGRSTRRAFAYLTFRPAKVLTEIAAKRLNAIKEFTAFGSGFRIAMRDMEIRGAGSVLGAQQHGHMEAVGYEMYLRLLSEAVAESRGEPIAANAECQVDVQIDAHIPEDYIESLAQRLDIYKKIAAVQNDEDARDVTDELIDRFGEPPSTVSGLLEVALVRNRAAALGVREISQRNGQILLFFERIDPMLAAGVANALKGRVLVNAGQSPYISVRLTDEHDPLGAIREALGAAEGLS